MLSRALRTSVNFEQKRRLLISLGEQHKCKSFVETGTYKAHMTRAMLAIYPVVRTIELSETLHKEAVELLKEAPQDIQVLQGDSGELLAVALSDENVVEPLVWLDAHWSAGCTAWISATEHTAIVRELHALATCGKRAVVAIDDIRCFDGQNGYPKFERLCEIVRELWPTATITRVDDVVWFIAV